jgi:DNA uptake protein ComE-like DNA-binding protein
MDMKEQIRIFLSFSKKERTGIIILLIIAMLTWIIPCFFADDEIPEEALLFTPVELQEKIIVLKERASYRWHKDTNMQSPDNIIGRSEKNKTSIQFLDINLADSMAWERLPGIGEKLSSRIVRYRELLGGFVSMAQMKEVYGISDSLIEILQPQLMLKKDFFPRKLKINEADYGMFRKHPYITHVMAKILLAYRKQHGGITNERELMEIDGLDPAETKRLLPYLSFDQSIKSSS